MSTIVPPANDMSITVAPASVVLVYKPRSRKQLLFMKEVCGERSSPAWWSECSLMWHSKCSLIWCMGKGLNHRDNAYREVSQDEKKMKPVKKRRELPRTLGLYTRKQWFMLHHTQTAKRPLPLLSRHSEPVYLCFAFGGHFPNWSASSWCDATSCGSACCRGNHPRLCSHGGSRWCRLQRTKVFIAHWLLILFVCNNC